MSEGFNGSGANDFLPAASLQTLQHRARLLREVRSFFDARGYREVETPLLSRDVIVDAHLEPFVTAASDGPAAEPLYLQTSPEFGMKRLLAAGAQAIYQITRALRRDESGRYHNPEFTMVEWYRVGDTHHDQMRVVEELAQTIFDCGVRLEPEKREYPATAFEGVYERLTYDAAFERYAGTRVLGRPLAELQELARRSGLTPPPGLSDDDRDGWLNLLWAGLVEPGLGRERPVFIHDYPASQAALARVRHEASPPVAERFELYVHGIELCNGYHELTDPQEFRDRMRRQNEQRNAMGLRTLPEENRLLAAMEAGLPPCSGVALGFDRLAMVALGANSLAEVTAFPFDRA